MGPPARVLEYDTRNSILPLGLVPLQGHVNSGFQNSSSVLLLCVNMCVPVCADVCGGQRTTLYAVPQALPPSVFETESLTGLEFTK